MSRLKQRCATAGSTLFKLTWKESATPSGRPVSLLRASARRISDSDCGSSEKGWNTPRATDGTNGGPNQANGALPADAALTHWITPQTHDDKLRYRRDAFFSVRLCFEAVNILMGIAGSSGLYMSNAMQRLFRDAHAANAHVMFSTDVQGALYGQHALGVAGPPPLL